MHTLIASLPILCYGVALVLGFLGIDLPFASAELSPLIQWMLFLALGLLSLWSAFSHAVFTDASPSRSAGRQARSKRRSPAPISALASAPSLLLSWACSGLGDVLHGGKLPVERRRGSYRRHGAQQELRHQQCRADLLVGHPHAAHSAHCATTARKLSCVWHCRSLNSGFPRRLGSISQFRIPPQEIPHIALCWSHVVSRCRIGSHFLKN